MQNKLQAVENELQSVQNELKAVEIRKIHRMAAMKNKSIVYLLSKEGLHCHIVVFVFLVTIVYILFTVNCRLISRYAEDDC